MRLRLILSGLFLCAGIGLPSATDANSSRLMTPLPEERLSESIFLDGKCSKVEIVEWRGPKRTEEVAVLDGICRHVVEQFPIFIKEKTTFTITKKIDFSQSISIIPFDSHFRNLNDVEFRFSTRSGIEYDEDGNVIPILGYHQRSTSFIYIYNTITIKSKINRQFRTVFAHELFHALSYELGIFQQHSGNKNQKEEELAQEFTAWLGYGR